VDAGYEKPDNALIRRDLGNLPPRGTSDDRCKGSGGGCLLHWSKCHGDSAQ